jgi:DNA modification methylase
MTCQILQGDCLEVLKSLPSGSVHTCVTSPPYYGLRDYGTAKWEGGDSGCDHKIPDIEHGNLIGKSDGKDKQNSHTIRFNRVSCYKCGAIRIDDQIGLEETPDAYVQKLVAVFREIKRVLRDDGTLWLNLGDSFSAQSTHRTNGNRGGFNQLGRSIKDQRLMTNNEGYKPKDLLGIPWLVAFALRQPDYKCLGCGNIAHATTWGKFPNGRLICPSCELSKGYVVESQGWYLRSDIIWAKRNCMPESVKDRPTKSHEYIFLLAKSQKYYYDADAIKEPVSEVSKARAEYGWDCDRPSAGTNGVHVESMGSRFVNPLGRNKRDVWFISTKPYKEAHFATFPPDLIEPCILAGCPQGGTVIDPFNGSGTTGQVALTNNRNYIGIELNPSYVELTHKRLNGLAVKII